MSLSGRRLLLVGAVAVACGAGGAAAKSGGSRAGTAHLYWVAKGGGDYGVIVEANLNGTGGKTIAGTLGVAYVAVSGSHLFWSNGQVGAGTMCGSGAIVRANLGGSGAKTIVKRQPGPLEGVAVGGGHLYWVNACAGKIFEANLDGTSARTIGKGQGSVGVAADSSHLYWTDRHAIVEANLNGTGAKTIAKTSASFLVSDVAVGDGHLYWSGFTTQFTGRIVEANLNGTSAKTIAAPEGTPLGLAVGHDHVYWSNGVTIVEANLDGTSAKTVASAHSQGAFGGLAVGP